MSFLSAVGKAFKSVFTWLTSTAGQAVISTAGAVVDAIDPALGGIVTLVTAWIQRVIQVEATAAAAGQQAGTGEQKAAAVISAVTPLVTKYFPDATASQITAANTAIVAFLNAFEAPTTGVSAPPVA